MTDFHIHVLPLMDDGAQSVPESLSMLKMLAGQGVERAVCTPHFYGERESAQDFLGRRAQSLQTLQESGEVEIELAMGAEIAMWHGMSAGVSDALCLGESNILLCELPASYSPWVIDELEELSALGFCPMIAHVDRVQALYTREQLAAVLECHGVVYQFNASSLSKARVRGLCRALCATGQRMVLGSDGHGERYRAPDMHAAHRALGGLRMRQVRSRMQDCDARLTEAIF